MGNGSRPRPSALFLAFLSIAISFWSTIFRINGPEESFLHLDYEYDVLPDDDPARLPVRVFPGARGMLCPCR